MTHQERVEEIRRAIKLKKEVADILGPDPGISIEEMIKVDKLLISCASACVEILEMKEQKTHICENGELQESSWDGGANMKLREVKGVIGG